ncbi:hypothetical protein B9Z55_017246 [Caenorhabditis nigoni]|uniref:Uncharacterized protein n=1 Tax=Caenorhabditis nigoni TaxID=1611254 RepID=A0A2G5T8K4_9PELO|nr:hypothetical protein B9Z55_017246 [Caenorhabditis nigoni]
MRFLDFLILLDLFVTSYLLDHSRCIKDIFLALYNYKYTTSHVDFVVLFFIRQLVVLYLRNTVEQKEKIQKIRESIWRYYCLLFICGLAAIVKLLVFDFFGEKSECALWSTVSAVFFTISTTFIIRSLTSDGNENEESENYKLFKSIFNLHLKHWSSFRLPYFLLACECICFVYEPILFKKMNSDMFGDGPQNFSSCVHWQLLRLFTVILQATWEYYMGLAKLRATVDLRNSVYENILHQPISFFDQNPSGELSTLLSSNCGAIASYTPELIVSVARDVFWVVGNVIFLLSLSWQLTLTLLVSVPVISFVSAYFGNDKKTISEETVASDSRCSGITGEAFSGARTFRSMAAESNELRRYNFVNEEYYSIRSKDVRIDFTNEFFINFGWRLESWLIYGYGYFLRKYDQLDGQEFSTFVLYHYRSIYALTRLIKLYSEGMKTIGKSKKVLDILNSNPKARLHSGTEKPNVVGGITIEDVNFSYESNGRTIINNLNLSIAAGQTVALVGPSGHGKSTLVSLLQRFYAPMSGRILLDQTPIQNIDHKFYHSKVALVAQEPVLFSGTIRENILYGYDEGSEEDMMRVAQMANVHEFVSQMADGYDTVCGERGVRLSGGQKQRVAIARSLVRNPRVLILDEATSALDVESEALVQEALARCSQDMTVLVIAHRLSTVRNADKIAVIENGAVSAQGTHEELMEDREGTYFKLVTRQSNVI